MKMISLKVHDSIFGDTEKIVAINQTSRNRYINKALAHYNKHNKKLILEKKLQRESLLVKDNSMSVLNDFKIQDADAKTV